MVIAARLHLRLFGLVSSFFLIRIAPGVLIPVCYPSFMDQCIYAFCVVSNIYPERRHPVQKLSKGHLACLELRGSDITPINTNLDTIRSQTKLE